MTVQALRHITGPALEALVRRVRISGTARVDAKTAELMSMELEPKTWSGRATHMKTMCAFMECLGLEFPLAEGDLLAFLGSCYDSLLTKTDPQLSAKSLNAYLSGIRLTHAALGLGDFPMTADSLCLMAAVAGYAKAARANLPPGPVRIALPLDILYAILAHSPGATASTLDLRDGALIVTAAVFDLRPAGAKSIQREQVKLTPERVDIVVGALKGKMLEQARRRGARSFYRPPTVTTHPLDVISLLDRWGRAAKQRRRAVV